MKTWRRADILKNGARCGVLAGLFGFSAVLFSRKEKFECSNRCGKCSKLTDGKCGLGLK